MTKRQLTKQLCEAQAKADSLQRNLSQSLQRESSLSEKIAVILTINGTIKRDLCNAQSQIADLSKALESMQDAETDIEQRNCDGCDWAGRIRPQKCACCRRGAKDNYIKTLPKEDGSNETIAGGGEQKEAAEKSQLDG